MLKKIILTVLFVGLVGFLIWGGVTRTQAKADQGIGENQTQRQYLGQEDFNVGKGGQQTGVGNSQVKFADDTGQGSAGNTNANQGNRGNGGQGGPGGNSLGQGQSGAGNQPLDDSEIDALLLALDDEYHALAVYQAVIENFGEVDPFVEIARSEQRHIDALVNQFNKHDIPVPENLWIGNVPVFSSVQGACQAGVEAEIANAGLYEKLLTMTEDQGLIRVFTSLSGASLENHLPAFQDCQ